MSKKILALVGYNILTLKIKEVIGLGIETGRINGGMPSLEGDLVRASGEGMIVRPDTTPVKPKKVGVELDTLDRKVISVAEWESGMFIKK